MSHKTLRITLQRLRKQFAPSKHGHILHLVERRLKIRQMNFGRYFKRLCLVFFPPLRKFKDLKHERVAELIRPFLLRRLKQEVVKELPEKIETNLYSELTTEQKSLYLAYLERIQEDLARSSLTSGAERIKLLAGLTRLRQICCDPRMFDANYIGESSKLNQLMDTVRAANENGQRILIFFSVHFYVEVDWEGASKRWARFLLSGWENF